MLTLAREFYIADVWTNTIELTAANAGEQVKKRLNTFGHGFTTGGHPVAAAVALETIKIIKKRDLVARAAAVGEYMQLRLGQLASHPLVGEVRGVGLIAAVSGARDRQTVETRWRGARSTGCDRQFTTAANGVISRSMVDALAFFPPLIISLEQVDDLAARLAMSLDQAISAPKCLGRDVERCDGRRHLVLRTAAVKTNTFELAA